MGKVKLHSIYMEFATATPGWRVVLMALGGKPRTNSSLRLLGPRRFKFASKITAKVLHHIVTVVHPETVIRWVRAERKNSPRKKYAIRRGRPKTPEALCKLILRMAKENDWGYARITRELKKMGIRCPSRNTVKKILQGAGLDPGPPKGEDSWDDFVKRHADALFHAVPRFGFINESWLLRITRR